MRLENKKASYYVRHGVHRGSNAQPAHCQAWPDAAARSGPVSWPQIARQVHHAHEQGILHRDLKPPKHLDLEHRRIRKRFSGIRNHQSNRFRSGQGLLVTGSSPDWRTQTGAIVGTPSYMAPEQAGARKDLTVATDVYSLGAILYELLTGRPPFLAANPVDTLLMVIEQEPVPPRRLDPGIDRDLELICLKCLQKPPELRYSSAAELAQDLEAYLSGERVSSQPSGLRYFVSRMLRETHHAGVLENWGLLWMWHSLATFVLCLLTQIMAWSGITDHRAVSDLVECRANHLGNDSLAVAPACRPGVVRGTADCTCLGSRCLRQHRHVRDRGDDKPAGADAVTGHRGCCGDGVCIQGRDFVGTVLHHGGGVVLDGRDNAPGAERGDLAFWCRFSVELFHSGIEVLSATEKIVTVNGVRPRFPET